MKYLYIELVGYKRFLLNGIDHFSMDITSILQLIIGTNGSGKSSLLLELSPMPAMKEDFSKTGRKIIKIEHHNNQYVLTNDFSLKQTHSFILNNEEKNPGGTISIQRELVLEHFNINEDKRQLVLGKENFTTMSFARRKEWFLRLCDTNYDYAISVYNKLKERLRDTTGALKLAKKTLVQESEKLLQEEDLKKLQIEAQSLHECLNHLLEYRKPVELDLDLAQIEQDKFNSKLIELSNNLYDVNERITRRELSVAEFKDIVDSQSEIIIRSQAIIEKVTTDFKANQSKIEILEKAEARTIENLEADLLSHTNNKNALVLESLTNSYIKNIYLAIDSFNAVKANLIEIFDNIPNNADKKYSQSALDLAKEKLAEITQKKLGVIDKLSSMQLSFKHMGDHKDKPDLSCPKCQHQFSLNYDENKYTQLGVNIQTLEEALNTIIYPEIRELEEFIEQCNLYARLYRQYVQLTNSIPLLLPYWEYLASKDILSSFSHTGIHEIVKIEKDLNLQILISELDTKIEEIGKTKLLLQSIGTVDLRSLIETNQQLENILNEQTNILQTAQRFKLNALSEIKQHEMIISIKSKIKSIIQEKRLLNKNEIETHRRLIFNKLIRDLQSMLATCEHTLGAAALQRNIVDNLNKSISMYTNEEEALSLLVKELSPTEGLIAEGLLGFIKNFVDQMNMIIKKIWSYRLVVQSCEIVAGDGIDLDYKFPMLVGDDTKPISDVSKGSTGIEEIINLAYRITAMLYSNLQDSPLFLDEVGHSFDVEHRRGLIYAIKNLIEQRTFSQIFLISHDFNQYGALVNSEYCVLNATNIVVPQVYNKHVTMR